MVLGVCRRILNSSHDAEDAFQATFLVFVRKAASIAQRGLLANWLYGTAYRTALEARSTTARRRTREKTVSVLPDVEAPPMNDTWDHVRPLIDLELERLPDKYRVPVILCDLEGKTRREAARQLGWPEGTVSGRLARARTLLARRLARHGLALSGGALAVALSQNSASASVPASLVSSTAKAAAWVAAGHTANGVVSAPVAALTEGVLKAMLMSKLKIAVTLVLAVGLVGLGWGAYRTQAADDPTSKPKEVVAAPAPERAPKGDNLIPGDLPKGPAPRQVLAAMAKDGGIAVTHRVTVMEPVEATDAAGRKVTVYRQTSVTESVLYPADVVDVFDTTGKKIDPKAVPELLKKEIPVLASADGKEVDPLHLRLVKEGTLILVLPASKLTPVDPNLPLGGPNGDPKRPPRLPGDLPTSPDPLTPLPRISPAPRTPETIPEVPALGRPVPPSGPQR
jgi:RNA polymerase sigma factor (sigma-70 family)